MGASDGFLLEGVGGGEAHRLVMVGLDAVNGYRESRVAVTTSPHKR